MKPSSRVKIRAFLSHRPCHAAWSLRKKSGVHPKMTLCTVPAPGNSRQAKTTSTTQASSHYGMYENPPGLFNEYVTKMLWNRPRLTGKSSLFTPMSTNHRISRRSSRRLRTAGPCVLYRLPAARNGGLPALAKGEKNELPTRNPPDTFFTEHLT